MTAPAPSVSVLVSAPVPQPVKVGAPPESVPLEVNAVRDAFANSGNARFLDLSGRFTLDERGRIQKAAEDLAFKTGGKVWLLAIPGKTDVTTFAPVHKDLHLGPRDVFFIFNGDKRHLQTVSKTVGNDVLKTTNKSFYKSQVQGTVDMLDELGKVVNTAAPGTGTATTAVPVKAPKQSKTGGAEILLVAVALAAVAWLVIKRKPVQAKPASAPAPKAEPPKKDDPDKDESKPEGA
ncbi:MAG: hypothetical protein ACXVEE_21455 [Polyangiales bacterium]